MLGYKYSTIPTNKTETGRLWLVAIDSEEEYAMQLQHVHVLVEECTDHTHTHTHTHTHSLTQSHSLHSTHTSYMTCTHSYGEIIQPHECETERVGGRERERGREERERQRERNMRTTGSIIH